MFQSSSLIATLAGPLGVGLTLALIALLFLREVLPTARGGATRRWRRALSVTSAVLLIPFVAFVAARLTLISTPVMATDFPPAATVAQALVPDSAATPAPSAAATAATAPTAASAETPVAAAPASTPSARPTPGAPVRVANAVGGLRTGQFEVEIRYANTALSTSIIVFDLGSGDRPARLHSWTTYHGTTGSLVTERIVIGGQSWTRQPGGTWSLATTAQGVAPEIGPLLPSPGTALSSAVPDGAVLRWYDPARDADLRLDLDPSTDRPTRLEQTVRVTGTVLTVTYRGWNAPVSILPPSGR